MQCAILAGGRGLRMKPVTDEIPKALVSVAGRPFVDHQLTWLAGHGITDVAFCIGYRGDQLRAFIGDGSRWGISVHYVDEGDELRGTAGALRLALDDGSLVDSFFVLYGDSYLPVQLAPVWDAYRASGAQALMTVFRNENRWDASNVQYENGVVLDYDKQNAGRKPTLVWIDYGLGVLSRDLIGERIQPDEVADLADLYRALSLEGALAGFEVDRRFYEVGSQEGLEELERLLAGAGSWNHLSA